MNEKISFNQLVSAIANATGCSIDTAEKFIKQFFDIISETLQNGETVKIKGFGSFAQSDDNESPVRWIPDNDLAEAINQPFAFFEAVELKDGVTEEMLDSQTMMQKASDIDESTSSIAEEQHQEDTTSVVTNNDIINEDISEEQNENNTTINCITKDDKPTFAENESIQSTDKDVQEVETAVPTQEPDTTTSEVGTDDSDCTNRPKRFNPWLTFIIGILIGTAIGYTMCFFGIGKHLLTTDDNTLPSETQLKSETTDTIEDSTVIKVDFMANQSDSTKVIEQAKVTFDTIASNRFLTTMARKYYGNFKFWVYIYEENSDKLKHPDKIRPGTIVVIPPAEKYAIDATDSASIERAHAKIGEIYSRFDK